MICCKLIKKINKQNAFVISHNIFLPMSYKIKEQKKGLNQNLLNLIEKKNKKKTKDEQIK